MKGILLSACGVVALLTSAVVAEAGQPSASKMSQMGLSGAPVVADAVAMEVRGFGYKGKTSTSVWGYSSVEYDKGGIEAEAANGYKASGPNSSHGASLSFAGKVEIKSGHHGLKIKAKLGVAGGFAAASAN